MHGEEHNMSVQLDDLGMEDFCAPFQKKLQADMSGFASFRKQQQRRNSMPTMLIKAPINTSDYYNNECDKEWNCTDPPSFGAYDNFDVPFERSSPRADHFAEAFGSDDPWWDPTTLTDSKKNDSVAEKTDLFHVNFLSSPSPSERSRKTILAQHAHGQSSEMHRLSYEDNVAVADSSDALLRPDSLNKGRLSRPTRRASLGQHQHTQTPPKASNIAQNQVYLWNEDDSSHSDSRQLGRARTLRAVSYHLSGDDNADPIDVMSFSNSCQRRRASRDDSIIVSGHSRVSHFRADMRSSNHNGKTFPTLNSDIQNGQSRCRSEGSSVQASAKSSPSVSKDPRLQNKRSALCHAKTDRVDDVPSTREALGYGAVTPDSYKPKRRGSMSRRGNHEELGVQIGCTQVALENMGQNRLARPSRRRSMDSSAQLDRQTSVNIAAMPDSHQARRRGSVGQKDDRGTMEATRGKDFTDSYRPRRRLSIGGYDVRASMEAKLGNDVTTQSIARDNRESLEYDNATPNTFESGETLDQRRRPIPRRGGTRRRSSLGGESTLSEGNPCSQTQRSETDAPCRQRRKSLGRNTRNPVAQQSVLPSEHLVSLFAHDVTSHSPVQRRRQRRSSII